MPIDASIPLQARPVQLESPMNRLAMMESAAKIGEYQRSVDEQNRLNEYLQGADLTKPEARAELIKYGKTGLAYGKALGEQEKTALETKKLGTEVSAKQMELFRERIGNLAFNPSDQNVQAHLQDAILNKDITPQQAQQRWATIAPMSPEQRKQYFTEMGVKTEERYKMNTVSANTRATNAVTMRGQDLQNNPTLQGQIAEAKEKGKTRAELSNAPAMDVVANRKALASAGYDPVTGKDSISELINKSTGSYLGAGTDVAGRVVGVSTEGGKAIKQLETHANKMALDMMNGKLGAGISNADRDFIVAGLGDVANPTIPRETRLAAWNDVKKRMMTAGMVEAPKEAPAAPTATKSGASVSNW